MVRILSLSLFLFLAACGKFDTHKPAFIDKAILPYVMMYVNDKKAFQGTSAIRKIDIYFKSLYQEGYDGVCYYRGPWRYIEIDPTFWSHASNAEKRVLVYHEMGHCDLNLDHDPGYSIMNPFGMAGNVFNANRDYYLDLLFKKGR